MVFKVLLIILGVYFLGKMIIRSVFFYFGGAVAKNLNNQMRQQQEDMSRKKKKKEGHVTINYQPKSDKTFGKEEGDYIDFEEVK